jgi:predicted RNA-binding protein with PUA domain
MKLRELLDMAKESPELLDYTLNLSDYIVVADSGPEEDQEDFDVVVDFPIRGIASHDETKELRFILDRSDVEAIEQTGDRILFMKKVHDTMEKNLQENDGL